MIQSLRSIRLSRLQLAAISVLSALASVLIITSALGRSAAQSAALAALHHPPVVVRTSTPSAEPSVPAVASTSVVPAAGPAPAAAPGAGSPSSASGGGPASPSAGGPGGGTSGPAAAPTGPRNSPPTKSKIRHVFVIALSTPSFDAAWGQGSVARYLNQKLKPAGVFLGAYETLSAAELPDYLALISGQAPNPDTEGNCATYSEFPAGASPGASGQVPGAGCVYPNTITTIADQVTASGNEWKAYIADLTPSTCVHPNSGATGDTQLPGAGPEYATRHNPFIYFHSLLDLGGCASGDVSLSQLPHDLRSRRSTPRYSFIAPGACDDGSAQSCPDGKPAGLAGEDAFLRHWVPKIERSAAYRKDGLIVIVFALSGGPTGAGATPTGALVLSPFAARGKAISTALNPYSILRITENLLGYQPLAHAKTASSFVARALPGL